MAKLTKEQIREVAISFIHQHAGGVRYAHVVKHVQALHPETPHGTVCQAILELPTRCPDQVTKPSRGLLVPIGSTPANVSSTTTNTGASVSLRESDFYGTFAEYLQNDLDEVTCAKALGGAGMKTKWGTPDVVGVYRPTTADLIKFPIELVAAEIKIDPGQPVVAFGQATAYRLFAAKSYIVMPDTITEADLSRLEALCMVYGTGLVIFNLDLRNPDFRIRVRAQRFTPDMFYVNEFAKQLNQLDSDVFHELFA